MSDRRRNGGPPGDLPEGGADLPESGADWPDGGADLPEGEGGLAAPQDAVISHVLEQIRGGETPDVVPAHSSVAGYAEFLAVEAVLDQRWPESVMEPSIERISALLDLLGEPQRSYPVVQLTGTNGKTSTARMVDALLTEVGLRTGRYTSPHLQRATERINLDNRPITPERYVQTYHEVAPFVELVDGKSPVRLSKFEVLTAMAYAAFADAPVEVGIVEVGLGGRWDATNVADAAVAVVGPVALDHAEYLGEDVPAIAREKAGIIKPGSVAILAAQHGEHGRAIADALLARCAEVGAQIAREGVEFGVTQRELAVGGQRLVLRGLGATYDDVFLPLHGEHQASNAALALAAAEALIGAGPQQPIDADVVRAAFAGVRSPGRLERMPGEPGRPTVLLDAAHNPHGAQALAAALLSEFRFTRLVAVVGMLRGKDARGFLEALEPAVHEIVITATSSPRAIDPDELAAVAVEVFGSGRVSVEPLLGAAIEQGIELAEEGGDSGVGVIVTGSVVTAGEARTIFGREPA